MTYVAAYVFVLIAMGILDAIWLYKMVEPFYRPIIGEHMLKRVRVVPALLFYLLFPVGIVVFAVVPALREGEIIHALAFGLLFGGICYATYDLTNYATLKKWNLKITLIDIAFGSVASGVSAVVGFVAVRAVLGT